MEQAYVPMHFLKNLVHLVANEEALKVAHVLRGTGISHKSLEQANGFATFAQSTNVYERVAELSTMPGIGFRSPSASNFSDHGMLGAMLIMAPTVSEALAKLSKFIDVVGGTVDYEMEVVGARYHVSTKDKVEYSAAAHQLIAEENLAVWKFGAMPIKGLEQYLIELHLDYPRPDHARMYEALFPECAIKFGQAKITAVLSGDVADLEIQTSNPVALQELEKACEGLLAQMRPSYRNLVMNALKGSSPANWTVEGVSDVLGINYKTLVRRLKAEGLTPKALLAEQKKAHATAQILRGKSDAWISQELGYATTTSFIRAFKSWTGLTPSQWRIGN